LEAVVAMKEAIPYRRFNMDVGHKPGMAAGRYPVKACTAILALVKSAEANAQFKGLHSSNLYLVHVCAHKAARPMRYGRQRGRQAKRTHVEVVLQERVAKKKEPKQSQSKLAQKKDVEVKSAPEPVVKQEAEKEKVAAEKVTESKPEVKKELPQQDPKETQPEQSSAKPNNKPVQEPGPSQEAKQE
jgi:hypothetical protein